MNRITDVNSLVRKVVSLGDVFVYLLISFAVIYIIYYVVVYFIKSDSDRKETGMHILWGIVGLAIILSIWGLVNILLSTFRTDYNTPKDRFPTTDFINQRPGATGGQQQTGSPSSPNDPLVPPEYRWSE